MRKIEVVPHDGSWGDKYLEEARILRQIMGDEVVAVHHIGSTGVPGLCAKPIIDILVAVHDISQVDSYNHLLETIGYRAKGENGIAGRRYFSKGGDHRSHHLHIYQLGNPQIERHLAFRDYLRACPDEASRYGAVKASLAKEFAYEPLAYGKGKEKLVKELEQKALEWYRGRTGRAEVE